MDKCRKAFEQIPEIKDSLSENIVFVGNKYTTADEGFYDLVNWLNGGWYTCQSRQAEVDELSSQNQILKEVAESDTKTIERLESVINLNDSELKEKDKRIKELEKLNEVGRYARQRFINKFIGIQNHIDVNAFKAMESDPECFVICAEDLTEFTKEALRGEHE